MQTSPECILYVLTTDSHSRKAMGMSSAPRDYICDVATLKKRPSWLTGVPTLLVLATKNVYEGTQCLAYLASELVARDITTNRKSQPPAADKQTTTQDHDSSPDGVFFLDTPHTLVVETPQPIDHPTPMEEEHSPPQLEDTIIELLAPRPRHREGREGREGRDGREGREDAGGDKGGGSRDIVFAEIHELHAFEPASQLTGGMMLFQIGSHLHT